MSKKLMLFVLFSLFLIGCQESNILTEEAENDTINLNNSLNKGTYSNSQFVYNLGEIKDFKVKASKSFLIDGKKGGDLEVKVEWKYKNGEKVKLEAKLRIPKKAYEGKIEFDMIFNLQEYNLELYPSPFTFDKPLLLDLSYENVDVSMFDKENISFNYIDGLDEVIEFEEVKLDSNKRKLEVKQAKIPHFSRYGWTRIRAFK